MPAAATQSQGRSQVQVLDRTLERLRNQTRIVEQARDIALAAEGMGDLDSITEGGVQTQVRRGPGRPKGSKSRAAAKSSIRKRSTSKRGPGRPKGSKNKPKTDDTSAESNG